MSPLQKKYIVLFPFMAQGHIIPFLTLALKLEQERGYSITFVNTPLNIKKLKHNLPKSSNIRLLEIPFDSTEHGFPPNSETTENLPPLLMTQFIECSITLKPAFEKQIYHHVATEHDGKPPLCIISDIFFAWSAEVAHELGTFHAIFHANGGYGMAGFHTVWQNTMNLNENSGEFTLPGFPRGYTFKTKNLPPPLHETKIPWEFALEMFQYWRKTDAMLFNTVEEIDRTGLTYFREQFPDCSIYAIGPIVSSKGSKARGGEGSEETKTQCMKWLDSKTESSVLYVSFGSQSSPSESQTMELAKGLESSNVNFLWVYRPPSSFVTDSSTDDNYTTKKDWLPTGFEERITKSGKGLLLKKWAPQLEILSHKSIGAFLSHCGWNSTMEALTNGVPMLSWTMGAEQPFNAQLLEKEMGVCVGVANGTSCEVKFEEVMKKIELVMKKEQGNVMRRKACDVMEIIRNATYDGEVHERSSVKAMDEFLNSMLHMRNNGVAYLNRQMI